MEHNMSEYIWSFVTWSLDSVIKSLKAFLGGFVLGCAFLGILLLNGRTFLICLAVFAIIFLVLWRAWPQIIDYVKATIESHILNLVNRPAAGFILGGFVLGCTMSIYLLLLATTVSLGLWVTWPWIGDWVSAVRQSDVWNRVMLKLSELNRSTAALILGGFLFGGIGLGTWILSLGKMVVFSTLKMAMIYLVPLAIGASLIYLIVKNIWPRVKDEVIEYAKVAFKSYIKILIKGFILGWAGSWILFHLRRTYLIYPAVLLILFLIFDFMSNNRLLFCGIAIGAVVGMIV